MGEVDYLDLLQSGFRSDLGTEIGVVVDNLCQERGRKSVILLILLERPEAFNHGVHLAFQHWCAFVCWGHCIMVVPLLPEAWVLKGSAEELLSLPMEIVRFNL